MKIVVDELPDCKKSCCFYTTGTCSVRPRFGFVYNVFNVQMSCVGPGDPKCPLLSIEDSFDISYVVEHSELSIILKVGSIKYTIPVPKI